MGFTFGRIIQFIIRLYNLIFSDGFNNWLFFKFLVTHLVIEVFSEWEKINNHSLDFRVLQTRVK